MAPITSATSGISLPAFKTSTVREKTDKIPATPVKDVQVSTVSTQSVPFDETRVSELRDAISAGTYTVNAGKVADAMISENRAHLVDEKV